MRPLLDFDPYPQGTEPGEWRFTPDSPFPVRVRARWGEVTPFVLNRSSQFSPAAPYQRGSTPYTADYNEIKALGGDDVTTPSARTGSDRNRLVLDRELASRLESPRWPALIDRGFDLWENAKLFGLLNLAMADGYIASWETKYHYKFWRPITAIR